MFAMRGATFLDTEVKYTLNAMKGGNIFDTVMRYILSMI